MQRKVADEYERLKGVKNTLVTFSLVTNVDAPLGRRLLRDEPVKDITELSTIDYLSAVNDPDVWPAPIPADHSYSNRYILTSHFIGLFLILSISETDQQSLRPRRRKLTQERILVELHRQQQRGN